MQLLMGLGTAALILLSRAVERRDRAALAGSLVCYAAALLTYEVGLTFQIVVICRYWKQWRDPARRGRVAGVLAAWGSLTAIYLIAMAALRTLYGTGYAGTQIVVGPRIAQSWLAQVSGGLPLTFALFGRSGFFTPGTLVTWPVISIVSAVILVLAGWSWIGASTSARTDARPEPGVRSAAWALALVPAVFVALSGRYQNEITRVGHAYLPVYLQYYGAALLLAIGLQAVAARRASSAKPAALLGAFVLALTIATNRITSDQLNRFWKYPRVAVESALQRGLFAALPEGAEVLNGTRFYWLTEALMTFHSGRIIHGFDLGRRIRGVGERKWIPIDGASPAYFLSFDADPFGTVGQIQIGQMRSLEWDPERKEVVNVEYVGEPVRFSTSRRD
jgi:hypothetical protein